MPLSKDTYITLKQYTSGSSIECGFSMNDTNPFLRFFAAITQNNKDAARFPERRGLLIPWKEHSQGIHDHSFIGLHSIRIEPHKRQSTLWDNKNSRLK
jgi:hypothetical protein